ncbi:hypothetical protein PC116_g18817 [Phytophthora cactorum]|nr:hypothetical protein PC116_g18817 [Phytophthora cactorum]
MGTSSSRAPSQSHGQLLGSKTPHVVLQADRGEEPALTSRYSIQ